jgi:V/A-type H+-transporting ATPase subunit D
MELQRKKKNHRMAVRGHKLLKEKRDGLMQRFMQIIRTIRKLREDAEEKLRTAISVYLAGSAYINPVFLKESLAYSDCSVTVKTQKTNVMGVKIPHFELIREGKPYSYSLTETTGDLDLSLKLLYEVLPTLVELTHIEKSLQLLAEEIESTRRRVNALEYVLLPELEETIRYITMRLGELERSNLSMLMKVKEIVAKEK